jgi:hypothetical protein
MRKNGVCGDNDGTRAISEIYKIYISALLVSEAK